MSSLYNIISSLSKEECRNLKILLTRTNNSEDRKDVFLFDYARKHSENINETQVNLKLYNTENKNSLYRLKNRLHQEINKSLIFSHHNDSEYFSILNLVKIADIFKRKEEYQISIEYLKNAEKKAISNEFYQLLNLIYSDFIQLATESLTFSPKEYIDKRRENASLLRLINEIDDLLSDITYKIRVSQNYSAKNRDETRELQEKVSSLIQHPKLKDSKQFKLKIYHGLSKILLQQNNFTSLEEYLKSTYAHFNSIRIFNKGNHDTKLQMTTYLINTLFKNNKIEESLSFTDILKEEINKYDKLLYKKYIFYYYNSLVINYQVTNKHKAIDVLEEAKTKKEIQDLSVFGLFVYLNLAVLFFDLSQFNNARKNIAKLKLLDDYKNLGAPLRYKIGIFELLIMLEMDEKEMFIYLLNNLKKDFKKTLQLENLKRDTDFVNLISAMKNQTKTKFNKLAVEFLEVYKDQASESDIINYNDWINSKI